jgi:hypothetical protein
MLFRCLLLLAVVACAATARADWINGRMPHEVEPAVDIAARPFPLEQVRLLEGPLKAAQECDRAYLRQVEPDRLLAWFRKEAGLEPKAEAYGGWERNTIAGHSLGHYLSAASMMVAATGDEALRRKVNYIVDELAECQKAHGDGYLAAFPGGRKCFKEVADGNIRSKGFDLNGIWVPWYTLHKQFAGLLDAYRYCGGAKALSVATRLADWACEVTKNLTDAQWQTMLACEHGGMNEVLAELYAVTGEKRYLALSRKFHHEAILGPLSRGQDILPGKHANTQFPKVIGCARRYEVTGHGRDRAVAEFFWQRVVYHHSYVTGGNSDHEYFGPPDELADRLGPKTTESCNTYNMLKLTRHLFAWHGGVEFADFYERGLMNHILASQHPETGMMTYFLPLGAGEFKRFQTPFTSWTCCHGTGMENHAKYGDSIYWHDAGGLYVALFVASELAWPEKGLTVRQETAFPAGDTVRLAVSAKREVATAVRIRCPGWAEGPLEIKVNGKKVEADAQPGTWAVLDRTWTDGDAVTVRIPTGLRTEAMPDDANRVAVLYGPVVLAGDLGPIHPDAAGETADAAEPTVPVLVTGGRPVGEWVEPVEGEALAFRTAGVGRPADVTLRPFYGFHDRRYAVYWDLFTPAAWEARKAELAAERARREHLARRTLDVLRIGEMQPERDHDLTGERTAAGEFRGRKWRHATDGGHFAFRMKVDPKAPVDLLCTYWGDDAGGRAFDILVDGQRIATQKLEREKPGEFFDVTYPIPEKLTRGKEAVTVRLQAHAGKTAGGLFGCRTLRRED